LAQIGDNVQRKPTYICNCCGCCCEMMRAIRGFGIDNAIVTSNWIARIDTEKCTGCGECAKACPIDVIEIVKGGSSDSQDDQNGKHAVVDESLCLGCGVCYSACKFGSLGMKSRTRRVFTPENVFERVVTMCVERGKLADLVFDDPTRLSQRALLRIVRVLERASVFKAAMAVEPLKSVFLKQIVREGKRRAGRFSEVLE